MNTIRRSLRNYWGCTAWSCPVTILGSALGTRPRADVGQLTLGGFDVLGTVRRYIDRIRFMHYKDVTFGGRPQGQLWAGGTHIPADEGAYGVDSKGRWVELGRGVVPFAAITRILLDA